MGGLSRSLNLAKSANDEHSSAEGASQKEKKSRYGPIKVELALKKGGLIPSVGSTYKKGCKKNTYLTSVDRLRA